MMFYEIIANGGNNSSWQKLFKTMNDKIGTKSTEKIRDYYYRMLKIVNRWLKVADGESGFNRKNRDDVILAMSCFGKMLTSSPKKYKIDMKKLNKHPRVFKRTANTLKKLITSKIKSERTKMWNNSMKQINSLGTWRSTNTNNTNTIVGSTLANKATIAQTWIKNGNATKPTSTSVSDFSRIINVSSFRKIPYNNFILRIIPFDQDTYLQMIESNYCPRLEINVTANKSIKNIINILLEKWKLIKKKFPKLNLFFIPLKELWIPQEWNYFSNWEGSKAYDVGDIYTAYGTPRTNTWYMKYQWSEEFLDRYIIDKQLNMQSIQANSNNNNDEQMQTRNEGWTSIKNENIIKGDLNFFGSEDNDWDMEKSIMPLESELNGFDPWEYWGLNDEPKNSSDEDEEEYQLRNNKRNTSLSNRWNEYNTSSFMKTPSVRRHFHKIQKVIKKSSHSECNLSKESEQTKSIIQASPRNNNNNNIAHHNNSKWRTGYSELFSQKSDFGGYDNISYNSKNLNQISSNIKGTYNMNSSNSNNWGLKHSSSSMSSTIVNKKKIPFINNVEKKELNELKNIHDKHDKTKDTEQRRINDFQDLIKDKSQSKTKGTPVKTTNKSKQTPISPLKRAINPSMNNQNKSNLYNYSQQGFTNWFPNIHENNSTKWNFFENEVSNFLGQNTNNYNWWFENNNTNLDFYKHNWTNTNFFPLNDSLQYSHQINPELNQHSLIAGNNDSLINKSNHTITTAKKELDNSWWNKKVNKKKGGSTKKDKEKEKEAHQGIVDKGGENDKKEKTKNGNLIKI